MKFETNLQLLPSFALCIVFSACGDENAISDQRLIESVVHAMNSTDDSVSFADFVQPFVECKTFIVKSGEESTIVFDDRGSKLSIPADAFEFKDGTQVSGPISIKVKNFDNAAEIAFANIPMDGKLDGKYFHYESAGMFEIRAQANNRELKLKTGKNVIVDYVPIRQLPDAQYFYFNEKDSVWEVIKQSETPKEAAKVKKATASIPVKRKLSEIDKCVAFEFWNRENNGYYTWKDTQGMGVELGPELKKRLRSCSEIGDFLMKMAPKYLAYTYQLDQQTGRIVNPKPHRRNPTNQFDAEIMEILATMNVTAQFTLDENIVVNGKEPLELHIALEPRWMLELERLRSDSLVNEARKFEEWTESMIDKNINRIVVPVMGIFNCDRIVNDKDLVLVNTEIFDQQDHEIIATNCFFLNKELNTAIRFFHTGRLGLYRTRDENSSLVVFASDRKIYFLKNLPFRYDQQIQMDKYRLVLEEVTDRVKAAEDLYQLL